MDASEAEIYFPHICRGLLRTRSGRRWERRRLRAVRLVAAARCGDLAFLHNFASSPRFSASANVLSWAARAACESGFLSAAEFIHSLMDTPNAAVCGETPLSLLETQQN